MTAPGYIYLTLDVVDVEKMAAYSAVAGPTLAPYGGEFIVRAGRHEPLEGAPPKSRTVIIRFPSYEEAKPWYTSEAYAGPLAMRLEAANGDAFLIEGVE